MAANQRFGAAQDPSTNVDVKKVAQSPYAIVLNEFSIQTGIVFKNKDILDTPIYWHKFIVRLVF